jgi:hypothetical protein
MLNFQALLNFKKIPKAICKSLPRTDGIQVPVAKSAAPETDDPELKGFSLFPDAIFRID